MHLFMNETDGTRVRYTFSILSFLWVVYSLLITGNKAARAKKSSAVSKFYTSLAVYTPVVWIAYPIIWAIGVRRIISVDGEIIAYAIIDILAKGVWGAWLLLTNRRVPETQSEVEGFWAYGFNSEGQIRIEQDA
jgi:bacteriorhodopsin